MSDTLITVPIAQACVTLAPSSKAQEAANCVWAAATLGLSDASVAVPLVGTCVRLVPSFNEQNAANSVWAAAKLGLSDASIAVPLARACVRLTSSLKAQEAANSLWGAATLGLSDAHITAPLAQACVRLAPSFNAQSAANSLWAAATLGLWDASLVAPLAASCVELVPTFDLPEARQVLQACYASAIVRAAVDDTTCSRCWALFRSKTQPLTISDGQRVVAAALRRLGFEARLETPVLDRLLFVDIAARLPAPEGGAGGPGLPLPSCTTALRTSSALRSCQPRALRLPAAHPMARRCCETGSCAAPRAALLRATRPTCA